MPVTLCITTFTRQDLLPRCIESACAGTLVPDTIVIVDQVGDPARLHPAKACAGAVPVIVFDLGERRGGEAEAMNLYLATVAQERIIAHDDVAFGPDSLARFVSTPGDFVIDATQGVLTYRDRCVRLAGVYDWSISPGSFLYVDVDYEDRLAQYGIHPVVVDCGITHEKNGTLSAARQSPDTLVAFWRKAEIARVNYEQAWGRPVTPGGDTIGRAAWRQAHMDEVRAWRKN